MTERPIIFSAPMVRAILEGRKTQTRRVVKCAVTPQSDDTVITDLPCPYGQVGDRLWVRETWHQGTTLRYQADCTRDDSGERDGWWCGRLFISGSIRWRPSIFMPRRESRITLTITGVGVERLQAITEADTKAEGIEGADEADSVQNWGRFCFRKLWNSINAKRGHSWEANPWVWVIEFRRLT